MPTSQFFSLFRKGIVVGLDGPDNRHDSATIVANSGELRAVLACESGVAIAISRDALGDASSSVHSLNTLRDCLRNSLEDPGFAGQRALKRPGATAFLVTSKHVVTARHILPSGGARDLGFVFGYRAAANWRDENRAESKPYEFTSGQVRFGKGIVDSAHVGDVDIVVIELDEALDERVAKPLPVASAESIATNAAIAMIGYPRGLPCKVVIGRPPTLPWPIVHKIDAQFVLTNVDSFQSNSGSPLIDMEGRAIAVKVGDTEAADEIGDTCIAARAEKPGHAVAVRLDAIRATLATINVKI